MIHPQDVGKVAAEAAKVIPADPSPMWLLGALSLGLLGLIFVAAKWLGTTFTASQREIVVTMKDGFRELKEAVGDMRRPAAALLAALLLSGCITPEEGKAAHDAAALQAQSGAAVEADRVEAVRAYHAETTRLSTGLTLALLERDLAVAAAAGATSRPTMSYEDVSKLLRKFNKETSENEAAFEALRDKWLALPAAKMRAEIDAVMQRWLGRKADDAATAGKLLERIAPR